jgi:hypothetical protein
MLHPLFTTLLLHKIYLLYQTFHKFLTLHIVTKVYSTSVLSPQSLCTFRHIFGSHCSSKGLFTQRVPGSLSTQVLHKKRFTYLGAPRWEHTYTHIGLPMYPGAPLGKLAYPYAPQGLSTHVLHKVYRPTYFTRLTYPRAAQFVPSQMLLKIHLCTCSTRCKFHVLHKVYTYTHMFHKVCLPTCFAGCSFPRTPQGLPTHSFHKFHLPTCSTQGLCCHSLDNVFLPTCFIRSIYPCAPQ